MADREDTRTPSENNRRLSRRAALKGASAAAAAIPAAVIPAVAVAAPEEASSGVLERFVQTWKDHPEMPRRFIGAADEGLAKLEAGYAKWQALYARTMALYEEAEEEGFALDSEMYRLIDRRNALRRRLVKIKTRSPRGVIIKIAMGVGAASLDAAEITAACEGNVPIDNLFPALLADLQAMERGIVA